MCYDDDELPPLAPIRGGADGFGPLTLRASDGVSFAAYVAHPATPSNRGVVILPDFRGLGLFYQDLAVQFAEAGYHAVTIDYYTRELGHSNRPLPDEDAARLLRTMDRAAVDLDVAAAVEWLRALPGVSIETMFAVGFCVGGTLAWHQAARRDSGIDGFVSFYGVPGLLDRERLATAAGSVLMLIAGQDRFPASEVEEVADDLRAAGAQVTTHTYDQAAHGFFSRSGEFESESSDAWKRVLAFFEEVADVRSQ